MANTYTGSDVGKAGLQVVDGTGTPDVYGVTKMTFGNNEVTNDGAGAVTIAAGGGGGGTPGGDPNDLQYNNAGAFGGITGATSNGTKVTFTAGNIEVEDLKDSAGNLFLAPDSSGTKIKFGTGAGTATLQSAGNHNLILQTGNTDTPQIEITDGTDGNISIIPHGGGQVIVGQPTSSAILSSNGAQDIIIQTNSGVNSGTITIAQGLSGDITIEPSGQASNIVLSLGTFECARAAPNDTNFSNSTGFLSKGFIEPVGVNVNLASSSTGRIYHCTSNITINTFATSTADVGLQVAIIAANGAVEVDPTTGTQSLNGAAGSKTITNGKAATLVCVDEGEWWLFGDIS